MNRGWRGQHIEGTSGVWVFTATEGYDDKSERGTPKQRKV